MNAPINRLFESVDGLVTRRRFELWALGRRLHAETLEPPDAAGPYLVFLHEGLGSIGQWKDFPLRLCLACGLRGLVYERRGFGRSEPLTEPRRAGYLHEEAIDCLPAVLAACGIAEPPILVGHSDGGSIALLYAAAFPQHCRAVISEAAHLFVEDVTIAGIQAARDLYETSNLRQRLAIFHGSNTDSMFRGWCETWLQPEFRDWNITAELAGMTCPALIIQGENDEYGTPAQIEAIAAGVSGPVATLLVPDCGHIPHHQARARVQAEMTRFIRRQIGPV